MKPALKKINKVVFLWTLFMLASLVSADASARSKDAEETKGNSESISQAQALPFAQQRVQRMSQVNVCMSNWATVGSQMRDPYWSPESPGGCFMENPDSEAIAPSFEYPAGSDLEHMFHGGIWIGAKIDDAVYTSVGCDGWWWIYELWPDREPQGAIIERSVKPNVFCYSPDAVSHQDVMAVYADTCPDIPLSPAPRDPWDDRKHFPLDVRITQKSYSWSTPGFDKFIIAEYTIENIGNYLLSQMYVGFYIDADVMHTDEDPLGPYGCQDDITGFLQEYEILPGDIRVVNIAWAADNDGHGDADGGAGTPYFTDQSPRSVIGIRLLRYPNPEVQISYNWWISSVYGSPRDWGPWKAANQAVWEQMNPYGSGNAFPDNALGTPGGDVSKYFIMSNGEIDYDQIYSCVWPEWYPSEGWLPVNETKCEDFADGLDTRFLLSFGPLDQIASGESLSFAVAFVIGESLHVEPLNLAENFSDDDPSEFHSNLDFSGLVQNALIAESLYYDILYSAVAGDANCDGQVDIEDVIYLIGYLFAQGNPPLPFWAGDVNGDCVVDIADVIYLIDYLFLNGSPPQAGCA
jgi:hypothetical protein